MLGDTQFRKGAFVLFAEDIRQIEVIGEDGSMRLKPTPASPGGAFITPDIAPKVLTVIPDIPQDQKYIIPLESLSDEQLLIMLDEIENDQLFHSDKPQAVRSRQKKREKREREIIATDKIPNINEALKLAFAKTEE